MNRLMGLVRRNLLVYFKDRSAVFFSMLTPIIVLFLYILFLKGNYVSSISEAAERLMDFIGMQDIDAFANGFLLAGILGSAMITVPYNTLSTIVKDRENGVDNDIRATPLKRSQIVLAYFIASSASAFIMTSLVMTAGLILLNALNPMYMSVGSIIYLYVTVLLGSLSATAFFMPIMMLIKSQSVSGAFMGIISAVSGFVIGAYLPVSQFSQGVQTLCNLFPATSVTVMLRQFCLGGLLNHMNECIGGADNGVFTDTLREYFSFSVRIAGKDIANVHAGMYVIAVTIVFIGLLIPVYAKTASKND